MDKHSVAVRIVAILKVKIYAMLRLCKFYAFRITQAYMYEAFYIILHVHFFIICNSVLLFIIFFFESVGYKYTEPFLKFVEGFSTPASIENWVKASLVPVLQLKEGSCHFSNL